MTPKLHVDEASAPEPETLSQPDSPGPAGITEGLASADGAATGLLDDVAVGPSPVPVAAGAPASKVEGAAQRSGIRSARIVRLARGRVFVSLRGQPDEEEADVDEAVDFALIEQAVRDDERVLVDFDGGLPVVIGVLRTRLADTLELRARKIVIDAEEELVVRSGQAAMRLREDGDVEIVGSRISTVSRGLFRLVGRMLRLN